MLHISATETHTTRNTSPQPICTIADDRSNEEELKSVAGMIGRNVSTLRKIPCNVLLSLAQIPPRPSGRLEGRHHELALEPQRWREYPENKPATTSVLFVHPNFHHDMTVIELGPPGWKTRKLALTH